MKTQPGRFGWRGGAALALLGAFSLAGQEAAPAARYGHRAYAEAPQAELRPVGEYRNSGRVVRLRAAAAEAFERMRVAARSDGVGLVPISGDRSRAYQAALFARMTERRGGEEPAARWVAPPGHSEHHTGLALDLGDRARGACDLQLYFEDTPAFRWLAEHGLTFGFELSFPRGSRRPAFEPWHWRFVGDDDSRKIFEESSGGR